MKKIVVIDDDSDILKIVSSAAVRLQMSCFSTTDANELISAIDSAVNLVIVDLMMPGFDGPTILRMLKETGYRQNLVIMSAVRDVRVIEASEALARKHGFAVASRLSKPFFPDQLDSVLLNATGIVDVAAPTVVRPELEESELVHALEHDGLVVYFQPQISLATGDVVGLEALVRLRRSSGEIVSPDRFIGLAERVRRVDELGWVVARKSVVTIKKLKSELGASPLISINVSVHSLADLQLPDQFVKLVRDEGAEPSAVTLEITESGRLNEFASQMEILTRLRLAGFHLSIDDFGTGESMMSQLKNVPATELKIDRQFVGEMLTVDSSRAIVHRTIQLGHDLNVVVVAEGVESNEQLQALRDMGCDVVQGYLYSAPLPLEKLIIWLKERAARPATA